MRSQRRPLLSILSVLCAAAALASCSSSAAPQTQQGTRPAGLPPWYDVPPTAAAHPGNPGRLIKFQNVGQPPGVDATAYRVMYASRTATGTPSVVTGLVYVPNTPAPAGGYPVVSWAHGTNGMAPQCAPSLTPDDLSSDVGREMNVLLDRGWELVASDYQGEGTKGPLPYLVGSVSAQNTIDIVRAARQLPDAHASSTYAVWGHSEGGQTAVYADQIGPSYAPDLHLAGVVAGAPPSQFGLIYQFLIGSKFRFYLFMVAVGFNTGYGDKAAPLDQVLTPLGRSLVPEVQKGCFDYLQNTFNKYSLQQLAPTDPFKIPKWRALLSANDPEELTKPSPVPLLIAQGGADEQIPVVSTQLLAQHLCGLGQALQRWIYPGRSHSGVVQYYLPDMVRWLSARFAGSSTGGISPTGQPDVQSSSCNL